LWASTSTKNPQDRDTRYVEELTGPDTVTTLPEATIAAFEDHGTMARTVDAGVPEAAELMLRLTTVGIDLTAVGRTLEDNGIASFDKAYHEVLANLAATEKATGDTHENASLPASRRRSCSRRS
jgi:transaldolase